MNSRLASLGWDASWQRAYEGFPSEWEPGRIVAQHRGAVVVAGESSDFEAVVAGRIEHRAAEGHELPVTGDWVAAERQPGRGMVHAVLPRRQVVVRKDPGRRTRSQALAANVDVIVVTAALDAPRNEARLDRYLALAWDAGAAPVVAATKADLGSPDAVEALRDHAYGVPVVATSAVSGAGVDEIAAHLKPHRTAVLLGPSGTGKSTLLNALCGIDVRATGEVRESDRRGRHTTTARELVVVPSGGCVIDTPGLREVGLWDDHGLALAGEDIVALEAQCRFRNCRHVSEPGCAVLAALADGSLDPVRLARHRKMQREAEFLERRRDDLRTRNAKREFKAISKAMRNHPKIKDR